MYNPFQRRRPNVDWRCWQKLGWRRSTSLEGSLFLLSGWSSIEKVNGDCRLNPTFKLNALQCENFLDKRTHTILAGEVDILARWWGSARKSSISRVWLSSPMAARWRRTKPSFPIFFPTEFFLSFSKVTKQWMQDFGYYLDILAVSCDSFIAEVFP